jgi:hypothetical protein
LDEEDPEPVILRCRDVFDALEWLAAMGSHVPGQGRTDGKVDFDL